MNTNYILIFFLKGFRFLYHWLSFVIDPNIINQIPPKFTYVSILVSRG